MIRVGFVLGYTDAGWTGGVNYLSNLLHAIAALPDRKIEPVLIVAPNTPKELLDRFPAFPTVVSKVADNGATPIRILRRLLERGLGVDPLMSYVLWRNRVRVLSHSGQLGRLSPLPCIGWIPDFQHVRMPEFFSAAEIAARNRGYRRIVRQCRTVLLSSFEAQKDLATFDSSAVAKSEVLNFAAGAFASYRSDMPLTELRTKYGIAPQYFLLPNQFWAHKNHRVVIDAIAEMTRRGSAAEVVCTGSTHDRRQPRYFAELMQYAERKGVLSSFRVLGQIPYVDLVALMRGARAIINPSMFEGWSTSVEEAKALGVPVILSDIPVHREQNPDRATYFRPADSDELAEALVRYMYGQPESKNSCKHVDVLERSMLRYVTFGRRYQEIVLSTLQRET